MIDSNPTACTCPSGDGSLRHPCQVHNANCVGDAAPFDLVAHLERQRYFSAHTFGPGTRAAGIVDHIRKELLEIEADPGDLREWVDVIILAFDGAWRSGATAQEIISAIVVKQTKNEGRTWPHWSTMPADKAIEHDRSGESAAAPEAVAYNAGGIELTACQLHEALLMAGSPELDVEFDDRSRVRIFHTDNGHSGPGLYCECVDVEEEGCILLDGTSPAIAAPVAAAPVDLSNWAGHYSINPAAVEALQSMLASTPAAPGIDLIARLRHLLTRINNDMLGDDYKNLSSDALELIDASPKGGIHPDDAAVDAFAAEMKAKLAKAREKGRGGWQGDEPGMQQRLSDMLREHVEKGDPRDVANFCMFLHQRGEGISPKGGSDAASIPEPHQECYSDDGGDSWYEDAADANLVEGLAVGDTYTLTVSHYSVERTYRVTKAPDETSDDYEVEPVQATSAEVGS